MNDKAEAFLNELEQYAERMSKTNSSPCYVQTPALVALLEDRKRLIEAIECIVKHEFSGTCNDPFATVLNTAKYAIAQSRSRMAELAKN